MIDTLDVWTDNGTWKVDARMIQVEVILKSTQYQERTKRFAATFKGEAWETDSYNFRFDISYSDNYLEEIQKLLNMKEVRALNIKILDHVIKLA